MKHITLLIFTVSKSSSKAYRGLRNIARDELSLKDYANSLKHWNYIIGNYKDNISHLEYSSRASVRSKLKDFENAIADLDTAIQINPSFANSYITRGLLKVYIKEDGCEDFSKALELNHRNASRMKERYCD